MTWDVAAWLVGAGVLLGWNLGVYVGTWLLITKSVRAPVATTIRQSRIR
jgi:hypothetical protein